MTGAVAAVSMLSGVSVLADNISYQNGANYLGQFTDHGNKEVGDQITLATSDNVITSFKFEYFLNQASGNEQLQVFFRTMDGPNGTPGSVFYTSDPFPALAGQHAPVNTGMSVVLPSQTFTWSVLFSGIESGAGEKAGLLFYGGPEVGSSDPTFYWLKPSDNPADVNGWGKETAVDLPGSEHNNFGARVTTVPEPGTWALLVGGLTWMGFLGFRRKA